MQFVCANLIGVTPAVLQQAVGRLLVFDTTITKQQALNNWLGTAVNTRAMIGAVVNNKYITGQCQGRVNNKHFVATGGLPTTTTRGTVNVFTTQPALPATPDSLGIKVGTRTAYVMSNGPDLWGVDGFGLPVQLLTASSIAGDLKSDVNAGRGPTASRYQSQPGSVSYYQTVMTCGIIQRGASADGSVINSFSAAVSAVKDAVIAKIVPSVTYIDAIRQDAWTQNSNGRVNSGTLLAWGTLNNDSLAVGFSPFELPVYIDETGDDEQPVLSWAGIQVDSRQGQNSILALDIGQDLLISDAWTQGKRMSFTQNPQRPISVGSAVVTL